MADCFWGYACRIIECLRIVLAHMKTAEKKRNFCPVAGPALLVRCTRYDMLIPGFSDKQKDKKVRALRCRRYIQKAPLCSTEGLSTYPASL